MLSEVLLRTERNKKLAKLVRDKKNCFENHSNITSLCYGYRLDVLAILVSHTISSALTRLHTML